MGAGCSSSTFGGKLSRLMGSIHAHLDGLAALEAGGLTAEGNLLKHWESKGREGGQHDDDTESRLAWRRFRGLPEQRPMSRG